MLRSLLSVSALALGLAVPGAAGATWSIVAVDPATREVGVAGASCIEGVEVIAGIAPGRGAVAAQAMSNRAGRDRAAERLLRGDAPRSILDEVATEAWDPTPWYRIGGLAWRQYAIASLDGPSQASFTGDRNLDWAGAATAPGVAVAGNTLASEDVIRRALDAFGTAPATCTPDLADRLVAALLAGAAVGGDRRCVPELGALSAFVAVAKPEDAPEAPSLRIIVPYEGPSELWFTLVRGFWPKRGSAAENPVRILAQRYSKLRPQACLSRSSGP